jgi:hypothetical protein
MGAFDDRLAEHFPGAMSEERFVQRSRELLGRHGFTADNAIACVGVCRDELCRSLVWAVRDGWGEAFNFSSLGGILTLGQSGFRAAHCHAPIVEGRERYVYVVMPHIGISADGEMGVCIRAGRHGSSQACGALNAFLAELQSDELSLALDPDNIEYSLLKQALAPRLIGRSSVDISSLTKRTNELVLEELERMISLSVDTESADYGVFVGVQVHMPVEGNLVWISDSYACIGGERVEIGL